MIGILSDSHDHIEHVAKAVKVFEENKVSLIIHAGDVCSPFVWPFFRNLKAPIKCVFGNNKGDVERQKQAAEKFCLDIVFGDFLEFRHAGKRFAAHHGDPLEAVEKLAKTQKYDVVVYGHDHFPKISREGKTLLINPGALVTKVDSPLNVLRDKPGPSVALYESKTNKAEVVFL